MKLLIANKNYSSWSLRPWLVLKHAGIPFEEELISFNADDFTARVKRHSPAGLVPVLVDGDVVVWDSLAIVEYLADVFPDKRLWPASRAARAHARSICAEMHSGFAEMRGRLPINFQVKLEAPLLDTKVRAQVNRIVQIWRDCRERYGAGGPFLFGEFSIADAFFAPVACRFMTYGLALPEVARRYLATIEALPAMQAWAAEARAEGDFVPEDEPYRDAP